MKQRKVKRSLYIGKIYRFMAMDGIVPSLKDSTLLYRNPRRFNDPLDVSSRTFDIHDRMESAIDRNLLEIAIEFIRYKIKTSDKNKVLSDSELDKAVKKELGVPDSINLNRLYELKVKYEDIKSKEFKAAIFSAIPVSKFEEEILKMNISFYICCFSKKYDSPKSFLMWSHYADSHKGACFEFDMKKSLEKADKIELKEISTDNQISYCIPFQVKYVNKIPLFKISNDDDVLKWMLTKSKIWKYEDEVRLFYVSEKREVTQGSNDEIILPFPFEYLTKVIFGNLVEDEQINLVKEIIVNKYPSNKVQFEKMEINRKTFNLQPQKIF